MQSGGEMNYRLRFHLMPESGWMNDPNGLCDFQGMYHVFYQYAADVAGHGKKHWGHYASEDLLHWKNLGIAIAPDTPWDRDGAYSGCAFADEWRNCLQLFYTGNVKQQGEYDYIYAGRLSHVLMVESPDGIHFSEKKPVLSGNAYPEKYSCHIRDPKVWKKDEKYYMILGGRTRRDRGEILQYVSGNGKTWMFQGSTTTEEPFGYMWECPDVFSIAGETVLLCCPQGVERETYRFQNIYQSGYFLLGNQNKERLPQFCSRRQFLEWDMGFDFYAPQTFQDRYGRRILIGWAGLPDCEGEYQYLPTWSEGWNHALTVPRVVTKQQGKLFQYPVAELEDLRTGEEQWDGQEKTIETNVFDLCVEMAGLDCAVNIQINEDFRVAWQNGVASLTFLNDTGCGRTERRAKLEKNCSVRILADASLVEIYFNRGELVFTTCYYPNCDYRKIKIEGNTAKITSWKMMEMVY